MSISLNEQARSLVARKYLTIVRYEPEGNGTPDYIAVHPELPGCIAQGETVREAVAALAEATVFWIESLLEDGLPVPAPTVLGGQVIEASKTEDASPAPAVQPVLGDAIWRPA